MPAIETTDWLALKGRVDTLQTDPQMRAYDPGETITPPDDGFGLTPFILLSDVTNTPVRVGLSSHGTAGVDHVRSGTLILTVQWPIAMAVSHVQLKEIAGQIAAHFSADTCMTFGPSRLRVTQDAEVLQAYVDGAYRVAPVRVLWSNM